MASSFQSSPALISSQPRMLLRSVGLADTIFSRLPLSTHNNDQLSPSLKVSKRNFDKSNADLVGTEHPKKKQKAHISAVKAETSNDSGSSQSSPLHSSLPLDLAAGVIFSSPPSFNDYKPIKKQEVSDDINRDIMLRVGERGSLTDSDIPLSQATKPPSEVEASMDEIAMNDAPDFEEAIDSDLHEEILPSIYVGKMDTGTVPVSRYSTERYDCSST